MRPFLLKTFLFCGLTGLCGVALGQTAPVISYNGGNPVTFTDGSPGLFSPNTTGGGVIPGIAYGVVSTPYGSATGASGNTNGTGNGAAFDYPYSVVGDGAGDLYVADGSNNLIKKIVISTGAVTTLAGSGTAGTTNGTGTGASFNEPYGICIDPTNTILYVSDYAGHDIRKIIIATAVVSNVITANAFYHPVGSTTDAAGTNLYFADDVRNVISKVVISSGAVTTYAGNGTAGRTNSTTLTSAEFNKPRDVAFDASGNLFVADYANNEIRKINASGVTLFAGLINGASGSTNNTGTSASFSAPQSVSFDAAGNMYIGDSGNSLIRKITAAAAVTTFAGEAGMSGLSNGTSFTTSTFGSPGHIYIDASGNMYIPDLLENNIRKLTICGWIISGTLPVGISFDATTGILSGNATIWGFCPVVITAYNFYGSSTANVSIFCTKPQGPNISYTPNAEDYLVNAAITPLSPANSGGAITVSSFGTGVALTGGTLNKPCGMAFDASGNLYAANYATATNNVLEYNTTTGAYTGIFIARASFPQKVNPTGIVFDASGNAYAAEESGYLYKFTSAGAYNSLVTLDPFAMNGMAIDASNNIYLADNSDDAVYKYSTTGTLLLTIPASGILSIPVNVAVDASGYIYVLDYGKKNVQKYNSAGVYVATLVTGLSTPYALCLDSYGDIYVGDPGTNKVTVYTPAGTLITSITGLTNPRGVIVDASGNLYVSDFTNNTITKYPPVYYTLSGGSLPSGISFNSITGAFSGTPLADFGPVIFTITANGQDGATSSATLEITVGALVFSYTNPSAYTVGTGISSLSPNVTGGGPITSAAISPALPFGLSITSAGVISGTPTTATAAATYTITATNASGGTGTATVTIAVNPPPPGISYNGGTDAITFIQGSPGSSSPTNTGGTVPAIAYGVVSTPYGSATGASGNTNSAGNAALFNSPASVVGDGAGNLYVADAGNNLIRKIVTSTGIVTTLVGSGTAGGTDGIGTGASFSQPTGICIDPTNTILYVSNYGGIRKIVIATATVSTVTTAFDAATGLTTDATGTNLYVTYSGSNIYKVVISSGAVTNYAGNGTSGNANSTNLTSAEFDNAVDVAFDASGNLFVADLLDNEIREINASGVTLFAGSTTEASGSANGSGATASFYWPQTLSLDAAGNIYVGDLVNRLIRKITPAAVVTTLAGETGINGDTNGTSFTTSTFDELGHPYIDASGNMYMPDYGNNNIRQLTICGWAISGTLPAGISFDATTGILSGNASVTGSFPVVVTAYNLYGSSTANVTITVAAPPAPNISYNAGTNTVAFVDGTTSSNAPNNTGGPVPGMAYGLVTTPYGSTSGAFGNTNGTGNAALFNYPNSVVGDGAGNLYVADINNNLIRKIAISTGAVTTLAGSGTAGNTNGTGTAASFHQPSAICIDPTNTILYVSNFGSSDIRKIVIATAVVSTVATSITGNGLTTDASGANLYVACTDNVIRKVVISTGAVSVYAGNGTAGTTNSTSLTSAEFNSPSDVAFDAAGNLFVADGNNEIREINASGVTLFAGSPAGTSGAANGTGTNASFNVIVGIFFDAAGNMYASDQHNFLVRKITPAAAVTTLAGEAGIGGETNGPSLTTSTFGDISHMYIDASGNMYVPDAGLNNIRQLTIGGWAISGTLPAGISFDATTGNLSGNATVTGAFPVAITAYNFYGSSTANVTINCAARPVFAYTTPVAYAVGTTILNLTPTVANGGPITSASVNPTLPAGLSITAAGVITGTPMAASASTLYTITAANAAGGTGTATVTITVGAAPNISYNVGTNAITFTQGTGSSDNPANSGGAVPNTAFGVVSTPYGSIAGVAGNTNGAGNAALFNGPKTVVGDGAGNLYVVDDANNLIRKIVISTGAVTTLAGSGTAGATDGTGTAASFNQPNGICIDAAGANLYVSDYISGDIRKIVIATGFVTTLATNVVFGPAGVTLDATGTNLYFADAYNNVIRWLPLSTGVVSVYAGNGTAGNINSATLTSAEFNGPSDIAFDAAGNLFVADANNNEIREINASGVTLFAGSPTSVAGATNGTGTAASFNAPSRMAFDATGNLYVGETNDIRKITQGAAVTTLSLSTNSSIVDARHMYIDQSGNMYVPDFDHNNIREFPNVGWVISGALPSGITFDATSGIFSGTATLAGTYNVAVTAYNLYGSSTANVTITIAGPVFSYTTPPAYIAGTAISNLSPTMASGGPIISASVSPTLPAGLSISSAGIISGNPTTASPAASYTITATNTAGNTGCATVIISVALPPPSISYNAGTNVVAFISGAPGSSSPVNSGGAVPVMAYGVVTTPYGSTTGVAGNTNGIGNAALFNVPCSVVGDGAGNLYVANTHTNLINKIVVSTGAVTTLAGSGVAGDVDGMGTAASFNQPNGLCIDAAGANLYVSEYNGGAIRKIVIATGVVTTIARSSGPSGITLDISGQNLYFPDFNTNVIYKVPISTGVESIYAGSGAYGLNNGSLLTSQFRSPADLDFDGFGNLFISDYYNNEIREINAAGTAVTLFAGSPTDASGSANGTGSTASFNSPATLSFDWGGNLYTGDIRNDLVRKITPAGVVTTLAGETGTPGQVNGPSFTSSTFGYPYHPYIDPSGNMYVPDFLENNIRQLTICGWAISGALPTGISFDATTGILSGNASVTGSFPVTITAYNLYGSSTVNVTIICKVAYDWVGTNGNDWNDINNWISKTVPVAGSNVNIGVTYPFTNQPIVSNVPAAVTLGTLNFGNFGGKAPVLTVNSPNQLTFGDINKVSDANSATTAYTATLAGTGVINAANLNITGNTVSANTYTEAISSSITGLNLSGNINLTTTFSTNAYNAVFNVTGGITSLTSTGANGIISTTNQAGSTSTIEVSAGTLQWANATGLSGLSATGTNTLSCSGTGVIGYAGANQAVYTDLPVTGLPAGVSYQGISFSGTGIKTPNGTSTNNLNIAGSFTNSMSNIAGNYVALYNTIVNFTGTAAQALAGGAASQTFGSVFNAVNFSNAGVKTMSGNFYVAPTGLLTMSSGAPLVAGDNAASPTTADAYLTLVSDNDSTAAVAPIPSGCSITGNVNVQRYISGDRSYRLMSSPVSAGTTPNGTSGMNYLLNSLYLTGPGPGFSAIGNPSLYLFDESFVPQYSTFYNSNYIAVSSMSTGTGTSPTYPVSPNGAGLTGSYTVPAANGYYVFYRGNLSEGTANLTSPSYSPVLSTVATTTGTLNQGQVIFKDWYAPSSSTFGGVSQFWYLVGNPYTSAIDLANVQGVSASNGGIYMTPYNTTSNTGITSFIYELNPANGIYAIYNTAGPSTLHASEFIGSGQGFFVEAYGANSSQLVFNESAKAASANAHLPEGFMNQRINNPAAINPGVPNPILRLRMTKDSINDEETIITFNPKASSGFVINEDARHWKGNGLIGFTSISSDNVPLAINSLPLAATQTVPLRTVATNDGLYNISLSMDAPLPALYEIWLKDAYKKDSLDIKDNPNYNFDILHSDTNSFGDYRFSLVIRQNPALMVHLLSFTAVKATGGDNVAWTTENEANYTHFLVQRSTDGGKTFTSLDSLVSGGLGSYSYLDSKPVQGSNSYRLQLTDLDGTITYSNVVTIMYANTGNQIALNGFMVYPNPTSGAVNLSINQPSATATATATNVAYTIQIVNNVGVVLKTAQSSSPQWQTDVSALMPGTYFITVKNTNDNTLVGRSAFVKL